jgi:hypothetical protein
MSPQEATPVKIPISTSRETYIAIVTAIAIASHLILKYLTHLPPLVYFVPLSRIIHEGTESGSLGGVCALRMVVAA